MPMHADMIAALRAGWPIVHLVTVALPAYTIRWTDAGFLKWGSHVWKRRDATYGVLDDISDITDGIDDDASPVSIRIIPPNLTSLAALAASDAQGGWVTIHVACKNPVTGLVVPDPYQLWLGELDQPRLLTGKTRKLEYDVINGDARGLQPNEEQRQTDAFRQMIWPGELGDVYATDGTKLVRWREDEPRNAIGLLQGRGGDHDNRAIEFSYEPNAPLAFPIGRCAVGPKMRYRVGYGPTNRYNTYVATFGASGPIQAIVKVEFNDIETNFDGDDRSTDGEHSGFMWFNAQLGDQPSAALVSPTGPQAAGFPAPGWGTDHKLSGRPAFMWTGKENSKKDEYRGGLPSAVVTIDGLFGHDPRDMGSDLTDPTTWPWMEEGCIAALNWTLGRWEGSDGGSPPAYGVPYASWAVGGIAAPWATIDVEAFTAAADIADANSWKAGGVPFSDEDKNDVLEDLLRASGAERSRRCGMISCLSNGAVVASSLTVTQADTVKAPTLVLAPSRLDRKNTGIASYLSLEHRGEMTSIAAVSDEDWVDEDGGRNTEGYEYRFCPAADQAAQLCYLEMANDREKIRSEDEFKSWMLQLEPGQAFTWNEPEYLLVGVKVRVRKRTWSPSACTVKIEYRQETDAKIAAALAQTGSAPSPSVPDDPLPVFVTPPSDFETTLDGLDVHLTWRNPADLAFNYVDVYRKTNSTDFSTATLIDTIVGAPSELMAITDVGPGAGVQNYWLVAVDLDLNEADEIGPQAETVPTEIEAILGADLYDYWDAAESATITQSGGTVSEWRSVVHGYAATQATSGARPAYSATGLNSAPVITGDGTDDFLSYGGVGVFPTGAAACEIWALVSQNESAGATTAKRLFAYGGVGDNVSRALRRSVTSGANVSSGIVGTGASNVVATATGAYSGIHVVRVEFGATTMTAHFDGAAGTPAAAVPATGTDQTRFFVKTDTTPTAFASAGIRAVIVTAPLSAPKAAALLAHLNTLGGI